MLTKKIAERAVLVAGLALVLAGCTPSGPEALLKGDRLLREGKPTEAVKSLEQAVELLPDNARAWNHLGLGYQAISNAPDARKAYARALQYDPNFPDPHFNLGMLEYDQGNFAAAEGPLRTFLAWQPKRADAWARLGQAQYQIRQFEAAERSLASALQIERADADSWNTLGLVQLQRRKYREAGQYFAEAVRVDAQHAAARLNLAVTSHQYLGDRRAALQHYRDYLNVKPEPENAEAVRAIVRQLEAQLGLGPKPVATNAPPAQTGAPAGPTNAPTVTFRPAPGVTNAPPRLASVVTTAPPVAVTVLKPATLVPTNRVVVAAPPATFVPTNSLPKLPATSAPPVVRATPPPSTPAPTNATPTAAVAPAAKPAIPTPEPPAPKPVVVKVEEPPAFLPARPNAKPATADLPPPVVSANLANAASPSPTPSSPPPPVQVAVAKPPTVPEPVIAAPDSKPSGDAPAPDAAERAPTPPKRGLLQKVNPVNWFRRDDANASAPAPEPAAKPAKEGGSKLNPANWFRGKNGAETAAKPVPPPPVTPPPERPAPSPTGPAATPTGPGVAEVASDPAPAPVAPKASPRPAPPRYVRRAAVSLNPGDRNTALTGFAAGLAAHERRDFPAAMTGYQKAAEADPSYFEAHHNLAIAALGAGDLPLSLQAGENALTLKPDSIDTRWNYAVALQRSRYPADAAEELEKIVVAQPGNARAHLMVASIYAVDLDDVARARSHYERTLALEPNHPQAAAIRNWLALHPER